MGEASERAPSLLAGVAVTAFVLLFVTTPRADEPPVGNPLIILWIPEMEDDEICRADFEVKRDYERMSLGYQFDTAIKPHIAVTDPSGNVTPAHVIGGDLSIVIAHPERGQWNLEVRLEDTPGMEPVIREGRIFVLGFPAVPGGGSNETLCTPSIGRP